LGSQVVKQDFLRKLRFPGNKGIFQADNQIIASFWGYRRDFGIFQNIIGGLSRPVCFILVVKKVFYFTNNKSIDFIYLSCYKLNIRNLSKLKNTLAKRRLVNLAGIARARYRIPQPNFVLTGTKFEQPPMVLGKGGYCVLTLLTGIQLIAVPPHLIPGYKQGNPT
jgi:hypothetical protein